MEKNEFWALGCRCNAQGRLCSTPLIGSDGKGNTLIPVFTTMELAQIHATDMRTIGGDMPRIVKIRVEIIERL